MSKPTPLDRIFSTLSSMVNTLENHGPKWHWHVFPDPNDQTREMIAENFFGGMIEIRADDTPAGGLPRSPRFTVTVCDGSADTGNPESPPPAVDEFPGLTEKEAVLLAMAQLYRLRLTSAWRSL